MSKITKIVLMTLLVSGIVMAANEKPAKSVLEKMLEKARTYKPMDPKVMVNDVASGLFTAFETKQNEKITLLENTVKVQGEEIQKAKKENENLREIVCFIRPEFCQE